MGKKKKDDETGPVVACVIDAFVLGPGERCEAGEILTLERIDYNSLRGMQRVHEADDDDIKARKKVLADRKKAEEPEPKADKKPAHKK